MRGIDMDVPHSDDRSLPEERGGLQSPGRVASGRRLPIAELPPPGIAVPPLAPPLEIGLLAPPWIPVPPFGYGGIEAFLALLARGLHQRGHRVTLFAAPGSRSEARVQTLLDRAHPEEVERKGALFEVDHVARAFAAI